ncbi:MAG: DUF2461 domain-containing protein [Planctomycetaceae bacterium]
MTFNGFPQETLSFLSDLAQHNDRAWFDASRKRYEAHFLAPSLAYIEAMQQPLAKLSPLFQAVPRKSGGSLMRIFRDVRFAKDKSPYKTNIGIHFRHAAGCDVHAPGFYVHIEPQQCFLGAGVWHPGGEALQAIRGAIDTRPSDWKKARDHKAFRLRFELAGDSLTRPPRGFDPDHPHIDDLRRKDFIGVARLDDVALTSPAFVKDSIAAFKAAAPFARFLCEAMGIPF